MSVSRVQAELKVVIPDEVRQALRLREGDDVEFTVDEGEVRLKRRARGSGDPFINPFANFTEWESEEDQEAFAHLRW